MACQEVIQEKDVLLEKSMGQSFIQAQLPPVSMGLPPKEEQQRYDPESDQKNCCAKTLFLKLPTYSNLFSSVVRISSWKSSVCTAYF